jgi:hypothetical protein
VKPKHVAEWGETRKKGRGRFLVLNTLRYGVGIFLLVAVGWPYFQAGGWDGVTDTTPGVLLLQVAVSVLGGLWMAWSIWSISESAYGKAHPNDPPA